MSSPNQVVTSTGVIDHCQNSSCLNGNCSGCRNGNLWCGDPRCHPNCEDCPKNDNTFITFVIVIFVIFGLFLLGFLIYAIWKADRSDEITHHYVVESHHPVVQNIPVDSYNPVHFVAASSVIQTPQVIAPVSAINQMGPTVPSTPMIKGFERIPNS